MLRQIAKILLVFIFFLCGCKGCGDTQSPSATSTTQSGGDTGATDTEEKKEPDLLAPVVQALASRVANLQNSDGSWDWERNVNDPPTPEQTGEQNISGIIPLGFFDAAKKMGTQNWQAALDRTANYFSQKLDILFDADGNLIEANRLSCPTWTFLGRYVLQAQNEALKNKAIETFDKFLAARNQGAWDVNPNMRADGFLQRIIEGRQGQGIPGIIPWDHAVCVEAVMAMSEISSLFANDLNDSLRFMADYIQNTFLPNTYDPNPQTQYADTSIAFPIFILARSSLAEEFSALIAALTTRLEALIQADGFVSNGVDADSIFQTTAYALLALKQIENANSTKVQDYLVRNTDQTEGSATFGAIWNRTTGIENYEVSGEVMRAIAFQK